MTSTQRLAASIVVPTHDRPEPLRRCLAALERQELDGRFEIVVVDDASEFAEQVAAIVDESPRARLARLDDDRGPAAARNAGARAAQAPFLLFTDDDCAPAPAWAAQLVAALDGGADAVAGATVDGGGSPYPAASQLIADYLFEQMRHSEDRTAFAASNNLGCRAEVMARLPFDERYPDAAGEDRDWCARLEATGGVLVVEPSAVVVHHQELDARRFWRQHVRYGRGSRRFHREQPEAGGLQRPRFYAGLLGRGFGAGPVVGALVVLAQLATAVGFIQEEAANRRGRR